MRTHQQIVAACERGAEANALMELSSSSNLHPLYPKTPLAWSISTQLPLGRRTKLLQPCIMQDPPAVDNTGQQVV
jgi:hypothetical protein